MLGIKKYIGASVLLLALIAGYLMYIDLNSNFTLTIPQVHFEYTLPVYLWIIMPAIVLFIFTLMHMFYYGTKNYFLKRATLKDINTLKNIVKKRLLKEKANDLLSTKDFKDLGEILKELEIDIPENFKYHSKDFDDIVNKIKSIKNGEYIPIKELKLSSDNYYYILNLKNRIKSDSNFAIEILRSGAKYSAEFIELAFDKVIEDKSMTTIKKLLPELELNEKMIKKLLEKNVATNKEFALSNEELLKYIKKANYTNEELIKLSKEFKKSLSPDQLIKLYEELSANDEKYTCAYLYVLIDFQMIDKAKDILANSQPNEYKVFKAFLDLRVAGKHYSLDDLIRL